MRKDSVGSVNEILLILAQGLCLFYYKRNTLTSTHDLLGMSMKLSVLLGGATNKQPIMPIVDRLFCRE